MNQNKPDDWRWALHPEAEEGLDKALLRAAKVDQVLDFGSSFDLLSEVGHRQRETERRRARRLAEVIETQPLTARGRARALLVRVAMLQQLDPQHGP